MNYLCLAAGKGTRFGRLGTYLQKCMYPIGLRPFLELSINNLLKSKHIDLTRDSLILIVGHHAEQIQSYFGNSFKGLAISYLYQHEQLGTGHALYLAYEHLNKSDAVIAWLADMYVPLTLFNEVQEHSLANVQTIGPGHEGEKEDLKVTTSGKRIVRAWQGEEDYYDIGLWKLSPEVLSLMMTERHGEYRMVPNLQFAIDQGHELGFVKTKDWIHLGGTLPTPEENVLNVTQKILALEANNDRN